MKTDQVILMQLPASISFNIGSSSIFSIANYKIRKPIYGGDFLFDISTYNTNGKTVLDSYSMNLIITPNVLSTAGLQLIGKEIGKIGILQVDFTTILAVPSGKDQTQASDTKGVIQLKFSGGWASDLGNGLSDNDRISCTSIYGILPISGLTFGCYIIPSQKSIEIRNFQDLKTGTVCRIYIPNIVISSGLVEINLIKRYNRLDLVVNKYAATPATTAGAALSPSYVSASYTFSNNYVSNIFNLEFNLDLAQNTISGDYFLVKLSTYDVGYLQDDSMVTCFLGFVGTTPSSFECIKFTIIDWILIKMTKPYDTSQIVRLYLNNLKWPRYAFKTGKPLYIVHYSNFVETEYKNYQKFEDLNVPVYNIFYSALMNVPKKGKGYPDCAYYFKFKALNSIPDGGTVVLTFPTDYSLRSSFPSPYFSANQFTGFNGNPLVFTPSANKLSISNIAAFTEKSLFTIVVKGIKNPSPLITTSTGWSIETNYNGNIINKQDNFDFFQYGNSYSSGTIIFNSITAFPQNALVLANYNIKFTPNTPIPALGIISITFPPAQFSSNIPANPSCVISGGLETFYSCVLSGTTITIITDSEYTTGSLTVTIKDVTNPAAGITDGFNIITFYDNSFLDQTDDYDDSYRTVLILPQANPLTVNSIDFEPRNEGEKAQYTFVFIPSSNLYRNMEIMIKFPDNYDDLLGSSIQCVGKAGIVGDLTVSVSQKKLFLTGLEVYTPSNDNPLTIIVYNVINPNRISNLGKFRIATYYSNTYTFIDYNEDINGLEMITAAGWLQLFNITADHYNARLKANYTFNFTLSKTLPNAASEGYILIDYPSQFDIPDKNVSCVNTLAIFGNMSCQIKNNRVYASGNTDTYIGNLFMTFYYIDNPTLSGSTGDLTVMSYDGFNKYIIERSFPNLDPFAFIFSYPGPLIIVNGDEDIIVEKGTQTKDLSITLDYPCALNLTFSSLTTSFSLTPTLIYMNRGDLQSTFRVSVPVSLTEGIYYINWQTEGDQISPIYTPLKKTKVTVTYLKSKNF